MLAWILKKMHEGFSVCLLDVEYVCVLPNAYVSMYMCNHVWPISVFILCVSVSVCTQYRSETGWTTAAVEGTGKESRGKGVAAACQPLHPLPSPQGTIKHTQDNFTLTLTHLFTHINRETVTVTKHRADHYFRCFDLLL